MRGVEVSKSGSNPTEASVWNFGYLVMRHIQDFQLGVFEQSVGQKS